MNILLYNPDNAVTKNFMPYLWMFLLKSLTPPGNQVFLVDGNARGMSEKELAEYISENHVQLVGIGAMTRMVAKAYRMADVARSEGVPVVMGGPHVTEMPDEALGRDGGPRHADAVALGERTPNEFAGQLGACPELATAQAAEDTPRGWYRKRGPLNWY